MKRIWLSLLLLAAILGGTLAHSRQLGALTDTLCGQLRQAAQAADRGHWPQAAALTDAAWQQWERRGFYLHAMLRHDSLDEIRTGFARARAYLDHQAPWELSAALAELVHQLELLQEAEQLTLQNVL